MVLVALLAGVLAPGAVDAVDAKKPRPLTRHALLNASFRGACGGLWSGRLHGGRLADAQDYQSVSVRQVALGNLDGRLGRDGALVLQCGTRQPYADSVALYTADRKGRAVFRGLVDLGRVGGATSDGSEHAYALGIRGRKVDVRWTYVDFSWSGGYPVTRPMSAVLTVKRRRTRLAAVQAAGAPEVAAAFASAMLHRQWSVAGSVATAEAVSYFQGAPVSSWSARPDCYLGDDTDTDHAECNLHEATVSLAYSESARRWTVTGGYVWN